MQSQDATIYPECPECGSSDVHTEMYAERFRYGAGEDSVELSATVPLRTCGKCGFKFFDSEAEVIRHEEVCRHLGVMTPREIRDLRERLGYSQAAFAEVTRLGEATLSRWERGAIIQNAAYDSYLYLLGFGDNLVRLTDRGRSVGPVQAPGGERRWRVIQESDELLLSQRAFSLDLKVA